MRRTCLLLACGALVAGATACRAGGARLGAREVAHVSRDVARRTGFATEAPGGEAEARAACRALLGQELTEASAVKVALLGNASVRAAYERLGIARADLMQAGLVANPVFSASAKVFSAGTEVELGLAQSFVEIFFVPLRRRVAAADLCAAQAEVARELVRLVHDVRRGLVAVRAAEEVAEVRREALQGALAARDLMLELHGAGNVADADRTVVLVGTARAQMDVDAAVAAASDAREALNVLLGACALETPWRLGSALPMSAPDLPAGDLEARALQSSLDLLESQARIRSALASGRLARGLGSIPLLDLGVVGAREPDGAWGLGPEVSTAIPIFDTGAARVLAAHATTRQRIADHEHLTVEVRAAARRLGARARALREREVHVRETYLPLRRRLAEQTLESFRAMQVGAFDLLEARAGEADARREHVETRAAAWIAALDLAELLAGTLHRERLEAPDLPEGAERPLPPKGR